MTFSLSFSRAKLFICPEWLVKIELLKLKRIEIRGRMKSLIGKLSAGAVACQVESIC